MVRLQSRILHVLDFCGLVCSGGLAAEAASAPAAPGNDEDWGSLRFMFEAVVEGATEGATEVDAECIFSLVRQTYFISFSLNSSHIGMIWSKSSVHITTTRSSRCPASFSESADSSLWEETHDECSTLLLIGVGEEVHGFKDLNASIRFNLDERCIVLARCSIRLKLKTGEEGTYTVATAECTAALLIFTATRALSARTAASKGTRKGFS